MKIMPISDSPMAPTGFGTNTRNIASIFASEGHKIGYAGCQNTEHTPEWKTPWPLNQDEKTVSFELLPLMYPGQERFGEKSFPNWLQGFEPDLIFTHLDIQMFSYVTESKKTSAVSIPFEDNEGTKLTRADFVKLARKAFKMSGKGKYKVASIIPIDGQPSMPHWYDTIKDVDYPIAMSYYGQKVLEFDFDGYKSTVISHGVDTDFFKPIDAPRPNDAFIVGCVARNQHRKNIPRLMRSFKLFVEENKLTPDDTRLLLHMDWNDHMGWKIEHMAKNVYGIEDYLIPPTMGNMEKGEHPDDRGMVDIYNMMDIHALPTGGEGFGIPTVESMACGKPNVICNYTTSYEIVGADKPECPEEMLLPHGLDGDDNLIESNRGFLVPYKDLMWDTPIRAAPMRAMWDEHAAAKAFQHYYKNRDVLEEHSKNARAYAVKHYDWNKSIGPKWVDWLKTVKV